MPDTGRSLFERSCARGRIDPLLTATPSERDAAIVSLFMMAEGGDEDWVGEEGRGWCGGTEAMSSFAGSIHLDIRWTGQMRAWLSLIIGW